MNTPYGEINVGDILLRTDGSGESVEVIDVDIYAEQEDAIVHYDNGWFGRMDWFKLMMVRYYKGN